jgi:hypothetical protein
MVHFFSCEKKVILNYTKAWLKEVWAPPQPKKHTLPKWVYKKYETQNTYMEPKPNSFEK